VNSLFDPQEVESERTVIISEREGSENEPLFRLDEAMQMAAFEKHPYRYEVIGLKEDLLRIQRDDLYQHYRTYYAPNNAIVTVAGDFQTKEMLAQLREIYGDLKPSSLPEVHIESEPPLSKERHVEISGPGETTYLRVVYRAPAANHSDFFAFTVLDSILSGPASLNMFGGGGISNKTSRLYRALVETELAVSVYGGLQATVDPFLYPITITIHPRQTAEAALSVLDREIQRLQQEAVPEAEIQRAIKQARALFAYGSENITNQAFWLGYAEIFASYDWLIHYVQELEKVTPTDIQRIAQTYLQPPRRVVGIYRPTNMLGGN